jgi:formamidopyrimidine-DNA glycosylase
LPELPDITVYVEALDRRMTGRALEGVRVASPFLLRTARPPLKEAFGRRILGFRRLGKRIVMRLEGELALVLHLMIAGRLHWREPGVPLAGRNALAAFDTGAGSLVVTEAGTKRRAALHVVSGQADLAALDPGGLEPLDADLDAFRARLASENHTLKRALTDPRLFSGIGNAYSDEILHAARLSPVAMTRSLEEDAVRRLHAATRSVLAAWIERLRAGAGEAFPETVTAFRDGMAAHGRFGRPCPACGTAIQRIVHGEHETNYCPRCQTGGRLLADRALSRLLKTDWPRTIDELERRRRP